MSAVLGVDNDWPKIKTRTELDEKVRDAHFCTGAI